MSVLKRYDSGSLQWVAVAVGARGLQGVQGTQGLQGIQGIQGLQGLQGVQGTKGDDVWIVSGSNIYNSNSGNVGIGTTTPQSTVEIYSSGSVAFNVEGSLGQLFSVVDTFSGSLFSVNDISGLPLFDIDSSGEIVIGDYVNPAIEITGSSTTTKNLTVSGSLTGRVVDLPVLSSTASMDLSTSNFFTLTLPTGSITHLTATNIQPGQTVNLLITQQATSGSLQYSSDFKFAGGIPYLVSATGSVQDLLSFVSFDNSSLYGSSLKNMS